MRCYAIRRIGTTPIVALFITLSTLLAPATASAAVLGNPDFRGFCNFKHRTSLLFNAGPIDLFNAYTWRCTLPPGIPVDDIDVNAACRWKYGGNAYGFTTNPGWAHSWQCRR